MPCSMQIPQSRHQSGKVEILSLVLRKSTALRLIDSYIVQQGVSDPDRISIVSSRRTVADIIVIRSIVQYMPIISTTKPSRSIQFT